MDNLVMQMHTYIEIDQVRFREYILINDNKGENTLYEQNFHIQILEE